MISKVKSKKKNEEEKNQNDILLINECNNILI